ncbi:MAG: hypothetical protein WC455_07190 [Dehalococcoidia bacterium]|jgi:putative lipoic acid-binding regulatory protein
MKDIIGTLREIHHKYRLKNSDVSGHTKSAQRITKEWQKSIEGDLIRVEVVVSTSNHEKIDAVDFSTSTAYELKVSGKNAHHEFYKDISKVLTYNEYKPTKRITKLVFISEQSGIDSLKKRLDPKYCQLLRRVHKLDIELVPI